MLTTDPQHGSILKTFLAYLLPSMVGLIALTSATIVDGMILGRFVGPPALAMISLLLPYLTFLVALSLALAIGGAVTIGRYLGEKKPHHASEVFSVCLLAAFTLNMLLGCMSLLFASQLYAMLQVPEALVPMMNDYFSILRWVMVLQLCSMVLYYFVRCDNCPRLATFALVTGALLNIFFDILFVAFFGWGVAGAAWATAIAQLVQLLLLCRYFLLPQKSLTIVRTKQALKTLARCAANGASEFVNEVATGMLLLVLNFLLIRAAGAVGIAAFSIVHYFIFLSIMLYYGIADALHVLVSRAMGAGDHLRARRFFHLALQCALGLGMVLSVAVFLFGEAAARQFVDEADGHVLSQTRAIMLVIWPLFLVNGVNILIGVYLTALRQPLESGLLSLARCIVLPGVLLVGLYLYTSWQSNNQASISAFIIALPLAEWLTLWLAVWLLLRQRAQGSATGK